MEELRENSRNIMSKYFKLEKNVKSIEEKLYTLVSEKYAKHREESYNAFLHIIIYMRISKISIKDIATFIQDDKLEYNHSSFDRLRLKQIDNDEYLENPFEVLSGVVKCKKCGSDKTMSYSKQDRSADEPMSVYAQCMICKTKWRENS